MWLETCAWNVDSSSWPHWPHFLAQVSQWASWKCKALCQWPKVLLDYAVWYSNAFSWHLYRTGFLLQPIIGLPHQFSPLSRFVLLRREHMYGKVLKRGQSWEAASEAAHTGHTLIWGCALEPAGSCWGALCASSTVTVEPAGWPACTLTWSTME